MHTLMYALIHTPPKHCNVYAHAHLDPAADPDAPPMHTHLIFTPPHIHVYLTEIWKGHREFVNISLVVSASGVLVSRSGWRLGAESRARMQERATTTLTPTCNQTRAPMRPPVRAPVACPLSRPVLDGWVPAPSASELRPRSSPFAAAAGRRGHAGNPNLIGLGLLRLALRTRGQGGPKTFYSKEGLDQRLWEPSCRPDFPRSLQGPAMVWGPDVWGQRAETRPKAGIGQRGKGVWGGCLPETDAVFSPSCGLVLPSSCPTPSAAPLLDQTAAA